MTKHRVRYDQEEADAAFERAFKLRDSGDSKNAIASFRTALSKYPDEVAGWLVLGGLLRDSHEYTEALECMQRAVALRPGLALASRGLFHTLLNVGRDADAISEARRFLALAARGGVKTFPGDLRSLYEDYDHDGVELAKAQRKT